MTLYDHIQELRAELANCIMTPAERTKLKIELIEALAKQAQIDAQFEQGLAALLDAEAPA